MKLSEMTVQDFVGELASDSPAPGGGSVAALAASLGAALTAMVASLTVGKEKHREHWEAMEEVRRKGGDLHARLLQLMEADTEAFNAFMAALKLPKETEEQKAARKEQLQKAKRGAIEVPMDTLRCCAEVVGLAETAVSRGNPNAVTDAGTAAVLARAAAVAAAYNIKINFGGLKDEDFVARTRSEMDGILTDMDSRVPAIERQVGEAIG
ncbi:MAG: cyclodeaminase/cyclohydrolase family protein [Synergistales bacterium]|nr:cyclodeaminase/cyclohydrolase family protein [Synergistales bacterium]